MALPLWDANASTPLSDGQKNAKVDNVFSALSSVNAVAVEDLSMAVAQADIRVTGRVLDENGEGFPGVNVVIKGTTTGTATGVDGSYSLNVPDQNAVLVFSFVGYTTREITVGNQTSINVSLELDTKTMSEVVVTALGIPKDSKKLGYSVATAKMDEMLQNRTNNMMTSLEGKIAGLDISPPSAGPAASNKIRIRGQSGFNGADNGPLLVINGLPMNQGASPANGNASRDGGDNLLLFNPEDIESMTVLKGATAAALYGARGSNGAIIITTKNGATQGQGIGVEYTTSFTAEEVLDLTDFQYEFGLGNGGVRPNNAAAAVTNGQFSWGEKHDGVLTPQFDGVSRPYSPNKNRIKEFFNTGTTSINTIAVSSASAKGSMRISFSDMFSRGITPDNTYKRQVFNLGATQKLGDKLTVSVNMNYTNDQNRNAPQVGVQGQGYMNFLVRMASTTPLSAFKESAFDEANGNRERPTNSFGTTILNPYFYIGRQFNINRGNQLLGTLTAKYQLTKWLYLQGRMNYNYNVSNNQSNQLTGGAGAGGSGFIYYDATQSSYNGSYNTSQSQNRDINMDFILGASHTIGDFSGDFGFSGNTQTVTNRSVNAGAQGFVIRDLYTIGNGTVYSQGEGYSMRRVNSLFGWAEIGWKGLVFVNVTGRQDWYSILNPAYNTYFYPSISGSFIFSELTQDVLPWLDYGKLRASAADVGFVSGINTYYGNVNYGFNNQQYLGHTVASVSGTVPNPKISPFSVKESEVGLELKMFDRRLGLDIATYKKTTDGQILSVATSVTSGTGSVIQNVASLENKGVEFMVEGTPLRMGDFSWTSSFNSAYNISEVTNLGEGITRITRVDWYNNGASNEFIGKQVYEVGKPIAQIAAKTYPRDANGNVLLGTNGRFIATNTQPDVLFGSALPTWTGGWNNVFRYKKATLLVHFDYKAGGKMISGSNLNSLRQGHSKASLVGRREGETGVVFPGVYASGPNAGQPNTTPVFGQIFYTDYRAQQIADPFIYKSDFIKLRNVTLSYDFTSLVSSQLGFVKGMTLSLSCRNVAIIKKFVPDLDPEAVASAGDDRAGYEAVALPTTRSWGANLNVKF